MASGAPLHGKDRGPKAFRFVLRRETRPQHDSLDRHPAFAALIDGTLGNAGYRRLMQLFQSYYAVLDPSLADACTRFDLASSGFTYQPRTPLLTADLLALGLNDQAVAQSPAPRDPGAIDSAAVLAGILYVIEGSLLGGAMLCAATDVLFEDADQVSNAYWRWCREAAAERWAAACRLIEAQAVDEKAKGDMIGAAQGTFLGFDTWLRGWKPDAPVPPGL